MNSRVRFLGVSAIVFAASAAMTIASGPSMSAMGAMDMPSGWAMSMMWKRTPAQTWLGATAAFARMWVAMMVAMMLPSLTPALWRYRVSIGRRGDARVGWLTAVVGVGYFSVWAVLGLIVFSLGGALAAVAGDGATLARAMPTSAGAAVLVAGVLQHTEWKARHLAFCRESAGRSPSPRANTGDALRHGVLLGLRCCQSCVGLTAVLLALGVMDLRVMALVTTAITAERLAPNGTRVARGVGVALVAAGLVMIVRTA